MDTIILILATYRLTLMFHSENGPWNTFQSFRNWSGVYLDENNKMVGTNVLSNALSCYYCFSVWIAIILSILYWHNLTWLMLPFALSGGAIIAREHND